MKHLKIYTDGACRGNPGPGGWGALFIDSEQQQSTLSGAETHTTNNRMELMAAIAALTQLTEATRVDLYTDSQYVQKGMNEWMVGWKKRGWKTAAKEPVKNVDLWQALDQAANRHHVTWHWVKGHSGHPENDFVDRLANQAIDELITKG